MNGFGKKLGAAVENYLATEVLGKPSTQVIPEVAVEAAADLVAYRLSQIYPHERNPQHEARVLSRIILEAAAPHMLAGAWDEGAIAGWNQSGEGFNAEYPDESTGGCSVDLCANPYRPTL